MRIFGNLMNRLEETYKPAVPEIGMGATILMYSDRHAATIVAIHDNGKTIGVQRDIAKRIDSNGMSESQEYEYTSSQDGIIEYYSLRKNGQWIKQGQSMKSGEVISIGERDHYHDFSF